MNKYLLVLIIGILILSFVIYFHDYLQKKIIQKGEGVSYQGPVPEGYDESYFRKTGITKPLGE